MTHDSDDAPADVPALDPRAAALLATYRRGAAMPPDARARVHAGLRATRPSGHVLEDRRRTQRGWAVVLAVAAAIALVIAIGEARRVDPDRSDAAVMSPSQGETSQQQRATQPAESVRATPALAPEPEPPRTPATTREAAAVDGKPTAREAADADGTPTTREAADADGTPPTHEAADADGTPPALAADGTPAGPAPVDSLREETTILSQGWRALAAGDVAAASSFVDEHQRRFTTGVLTPEREALAAVVACTREADAVALARTFLTAHPRSPLTRRVREACRLTRDSEAR